jgi:class 3 adenylate cyclase/TolB-like protein/cytochrome c-type biogenesis protein CcmH/NrfG
MASQYDTEYTAFGHGEVNSIRTSTETAALTSAPDAAPARKRKLAAILHADVVGFSRLMGEDEAGTHEALGRLRRVIDPLIAAHGGRIVGTAGDSVLADFASVVDVLNCAVEMQRAAHATNEGVPPARRLELRIGVNLGDVIIDDDNIFGDGVNIAARLEGLASPGAICISHTVYEQVRNKLALEYRPLGSHRVKNIAAPVRAYEVAVSTAAARQRRRWPFAIAGSVIIVAAAFLFWAFHQELPLHQIGAGFAAKPVEVTSLPAPNRLAGRPSVAVLPLRNLSSDTGHDFFSDGVTEDVITALSRFSNLLVISKSASFRFKDSTAPPAEIGRALDARYLLTGSIRRNGNRVRVGTELTEAPTGRLVWSENYDPETGDIFAVQDNIAKQVVGAASVKLTRFEQERVQTKPTSSLDAYEYVLRGRDWRSHATQESNDEASELFQRAIDLDPNYADAYAALGGSHYEAVTSGWVEFRTEELERAETLARKALAIDPANTRAHGLLAFIYMYRKEFDLGIAQIDRALEINPSDPDNYSFRGSLLVWQGKAAEALPWLEAALRFDRASSFTAERLCTAYYLLHRYAEAVDACDRVLSSSPNRNTLMLAHPLLAAAYAEQGIQQQAASERNAALRLWPLLNAETFAAQFGAKEAQDHMLEGLRKAGFY